MTDSQIISLFQNINTWQSKGKRAPHKPLLILLALGEVQRGNRGFIPFQTIEPKLKELLVDFGPPSKSIRPSYPFTRLANDKIWIFDKPGLFETSSDPPIGILRHYDVQGKFPSELIESFQINPELIKELAISILSQNFPSTIHQDILDAVGLDLNLDSITYSRKKRDPLFREKILLAYEYQCAVCGFGVRLRNKILALEAAHIMWHQAGGPDIEVNGLALCSTHHKLFDLGAFTIGEKLNMQVSNEVNGIGANEWLINHHGKSLRPPQSKRYYPSQEYLTWHVNEVFKGNSRD